jgi:hypothetical protein
MAKKLFRTKFICMILVLLSLSLGLFAQQNLQQNPQHDSLQKPPRKPGYLRHEKAEFKIGGSVPFTWNASLEFVIEKSGIRAGILAQGPHDRYRPMVVDAKPSITTYGALLGWGYSKWLSPFKGTGAYCYLGSGTTKSTNVKFHYNYGYVLQLVGTLTPGSLYSMGVFVQYKEMFRVINKEERGLTWQTEQERLSSVNFGVVFQF